MIGKCASLYTIVDEVSSTGNNVNMLVNKVRDHTDCLERPIFTSGILSTIGTSVPAMGQFVSKYIIDKYRLFHDILLY